MEDAQPFHRQVGQRTSQEESQHIDGVEQTGLNVADERSAAIEMGIPERDYTLAEALRNEAVGGIEERSQVSAVGRHPRPTPDDAPEEAHGGQRQYTKAGHVPVIQSRPAPAAMPLPGDEVAYQPK